MVIPLEGLSNEAPHIEGDDEAHDVVEHVLRGEGNVLFVILDQIIERIGDFEVLGVDLHLILFVDFFR